MTLIERLMKQITFNAAEVTGGGGEGQPPSQSDATSDAGVAPAPGEGGDNPPADKPADAPADQGKTEELDTSSLLDADPEKLGTDEGEKKEGEDGEKKAEDDKGDEGEKKADAFDPAQIKMPEGMTVDQAAMEKFTPVAKELGLNTEQAQKVVDAYVEIRKQDELAFTQLQAQWKKAAMDDPDIGKANMKDTVTKAQRALASYGNQQFRELLNAAGIGNHPETLRFLRQVGATVLDDKPVTSEVAAPAPKTAVDILYPNQKG